MRYRAWRCPTWPSLTYGNRLLTYDRSISNDESAQVFLLIRSVAAIGGPSPVSAAKWRSTVASFGFGPPSSVLVDSLPRTATRLPRAVCRRSAELDTGPSCSGGSGDPVTVNNWLGILRVIVTSAVSEHDLPRNPVAGIEDIDTSTHTSPGTPTSRRSSGRRSAVTQTTRCPTSTAPSLSGRFRLLSARSSRWPNTASSYRTARRGGTVVGTVPQTANYHPAVAR
jgi:hypothetical protein